MNNVITISKLIRPFKKTIYIDGDKSLSIRWALLASQANGKSTSLNLLRSEDVLNTLNCLKKLGIKTRISKYLSKTKPLSDYYKVQYSKGYYEVDRNKEIEEINKDIIKISQNLGI